MIPKTWTELTWRGASVDVEVLPLYHRPHYR